MKDKDLYGCFSHQEYEAYVAEIKERWGGSEAYHHSKERMRKLGKEGMKLALAKIEHIGISVSICMQKGLSPESKETQALIAQHYEALRVFYEPYTDIYDGLSGINTADKRFEEYYEKITSGLARYMRDAVRFHVAEMKKKSKS